MLGGLSINHINHICGQDERQKLHGRAVAAAGALVPTPRTGENYCRVLVLGAAAGGASEREFGGVARSAGRCTDQILRVRISNNACICKNPVKGFGNELASALKCPLTIILD